MWHVLLVALALAKPALPAAPPPLPAADVIKGVQTYYTSIQKLKADFTQNYNNALIGKPSASSGKMYIEKPGKMRWDYLKPDPKHFISDGTTLWVYEPLNKQAFQQDLAQQVLPVAVTFLYGQGDLSKDFTATLDPGKFGSSDSYCLKLTPVAPSPQYKNLWLVVDPKDFHVEESVILEASGNTNHFKFFDIKLNNDKLVQAKFFKFTPPAGVKVIKPAAAPAPAAPAPAKP